MLLGARRYIAFQALLDVGGRYYDVGQGKQRCTAGVVPRPWWLIGQEEYSSNEGSPDDGTQSEHECEKQALAIQPSLMCSCRLLEGDEVALAQRSHDRQKDFCEACSIWATEEVVAWKSAEHNIGRNEVGENEVAVFLKSRRCLEVRLLETLRSPWVLVAVKVKTA